MLIEFKRLVFEVEQRDPGAGAGHDLSFHVQHDFSVGLVVDEKAQLCAFHDFQIDFLVSGFAYCDVQRAFRAGHGKDAAVIFQVKGILKTSS